MTKDERLHADLRRSRSSFVQAFKLQRRCIHGWHNHYLPRVVVDQEVANMGTRMYSERLGVLDDRQFQAALARLGLGNFVRADPLSGGLFGQNVSVTSTTGAWVLRGMPHYDWQLPAERFSCELLHTRTRTPVPWPYLLDPRDDI